MSVSDKSISKKTAFLNFFRGLFTIRVFDFLMARLTCGREVNSLIVRVMPPNYLFKNPTEKFVERSSVKMRMNLHDYIDHALYFYYKDPSRDELLANAAGSKVVLDVGANNGYTALRISKLEGVQKVIAFEPDPGNFEKARLNIGLNLNSDSIELLNIGLGSRAAALDLYTPIESNSGAMRVSNDPSAERSTSKINVERLDDLMTELDLDRVDFIKIDVEGYEMEVLKGGIDTLRDFRPKLFIEIDDANLSDQSSSAREVVGFLIDLGYRCTNTVTSELLSVEYDFTGKHFDAICVPDSMCKPTSESKSDGS
jgi:FkbM family methyltransferase